MDTARDKGAEDKHRVSAAVEVAEDKEKFPDRIEPDIRSDFPPVADRKDNRSIPVASADNETFRAPAGSEDEEYWAWGAVEPVKVSVVGFGCRF